MLFHGFPWGTSREDFIARMGRPKLTEEVDGLLSMVYDNLIVSGYQAFMVAYFSKTGLEGGTYYFNTFSQDELIKCYKDMQAELLGQYGPTPLCDGEMNGVIIRELRVYETAWDLPTGYIYLKLNTRHPEPVTVWFSSPTLTSTLTGGN